MRKSLINLAKKPTLLRKHFASFAKYRAKHSKALDIDYEGFTQATQSISQAGASIAQTLHTLCNRVQSSESQRGVEKRH